MANNISHEQDFCCPQADDHKPIITTAGNYQPAVGSEIGFDLNKIVPCKRTRKQLEEATIAYRWASGWWLLRHSDDGGIFCCFNPLISWPDNYIALPTRFPLCPPKTVDGGCPIVAGFSAEPTNSADWTVLVVGGERHSAFSTFRRGDSLWKRYRFSGVTDRRGDCVGIGFQGGEFFSLFDNGDLLIFGLEDDGGRRTLLAADPPLSPAQLDDAGESLRLLIPAGAAEGREIASSLAVSWGRVHVNGDRKFRLLKVERGEPTAAAEAEELEEGDGATVLLGYQYQQGYAVERTWKEEMRKAAIQGAVVGTVGFLLLVALFLLVIGPTIATVEQ